MSRPNNGNLNIRCLDGADSLEGVAGLVSQAFLNSPVFAGIDAARYQVEPILRSMLRGRPVVATLDGVFVGSVTVFPRTDTSPLDEFRTHMQVGLLAVAPSAAGMGVGVALMDAAEDLILREGGSCAALSVTQRGAQLIRMYEGRGYGKVREYHWPQAVDPSWIMMKSLPRG